MTISHGSACILQYFNFVKEQEQIQHSISLYLKIETTIQYLVSSLTSQIFLPYFSHLISHSAVPNYCLVFLPSTPYLLNPSIPFFLPPSSLLIDLPPCSSPLAFNTAADLLNLNSAAYLSIQVLQSSMIPVTWQPLWALWVSTENWSPCKSWLRG